MRELSEKKLEKALRYKELLEKEEEAKKRRSEEKNINSQKNVAFQFLRSTD